MENGSEIQLLVYQEGYVRLFLEGGEDRLAKNRETCHKGKVISYHAVSEEWFLLSSLVLPPLEQLIEKEQILELMGLLTVPHPAKCCHKRLRNCGCVMPSSFAISHCVSP